MPWGSYHEYEPEDYDDERPVNRCTCGRDGSHADSDPCEECPIHGGATEEDAE